MAKKLTLRRIHKEVVRLDPTLKPGDPSFISATILLAALQAGTAIKSLATFTRLPRRVVATRVHRLKANGVFGRDGRILADWFRKHGAISFWADVCVAEGLINRAGSKAAIADNQRRAKAAKRSHAKRAVTSAASEAQ